MRPRDCQERTSAGRGLGQPERLGPATGVRVFAASIMSIRQPRPRRARRRGRNRSRRSRGPRKETTGGAGLIVVDEGGPPASGTAVRSTAGGGAGYRDRMFKGTVTSCSRVPRPHGDPPVQRTMLQEGRGRRRAGTVTHGPLRRFDGRGRGDRGARQQAGTGLPPARGLSTPAGRAE